MIDQTPRTLTTVKIPKAIYEDFKVLSKLSKIYLQDITERALFLYVTDTEFRHKISSTYSTYYTGSSFVEEVKNIKSR